MSLRGLLAEMRRRGVLKVAAAYLVTGAVVLEGVSILFHNFEAPHWVLKVFSTLVIMGFPIACLMAWGFEFSSQGVHPAKPAAAEAVKPRGSDLLFGVLLLAILAGVAALAWQPWRAQHAAAPEETARTSIPVVVIMDTAAQHGVYDQDVRDAGGTNADTLTETLRDLPILLQKETVGATWAREDQVLKESPSLVLIHRSSFFHSMNQEFGFGYPGEPDFEEVRARALYAISQNKIVAFLGYVGQVSPGTRFLVYGRGTGGEWDNEQDRAKWVAQAEGRFPVLKGRITTLGIPGGVAAGSMRDEMTQQLFREQVRTLLKLEEASTARAGGHQT